MIAVIRSPFGFTWFFSLFSLHLRLRCIMRLQPSFIYGLLRLLFARIKNHNLLGCDPLSLPFPLIHVKFKHHFPLN